MLSVLGRCQELERIVIHWINHVNTTRRSAVAMNIGSQSPLADNLAGILLKFHVR